MQLAQVIGPAPKWYTDVCNNEIIPRVQRHPFICSAMDGWLPAVRAFVDGMTPYIFSLGGEIANRPLRNVLPTGSTDERTLALLEARQAELRSTDGPHSELWLALATSYGMRLDLRRTPKPALARLLNVLTSADDATFYASLATCQAIACAVSHLSRHRDIRLRADCSWFSAHLHSFPTHEDIYRFASWRLLMATHEPRAIDRFKNDMRGTLQFFVEVADEMGRTVHPPLVAL